MTTVDAWQDVLGQLHELKPGIVQAAKVGASYYEEVKLITKQLKERLPGSTYSQLAFSIREVVVGTCRAVYEQEKGHDFLTDTGFGTDTVTVEQNVLRPIPKSVQLAYGLPAWGLDGEAAQLAGHESDGELLAEILEEMKPQLTKCVTKEVTVDALTAEVKKRYSSKACRKVTSEELESLTPSIQSMIKIRLKALEKEA